MRNYCDITILLDRSGSMSAIREGTIQGVNAFIEEQRAVPGEGCWTLILFDEPNSANGAGEHFPHTVFAQVPQGEVRGLTDDNFQPRGGTALIDAACWTIDSVGKRLRSTPEHLRPNKVLVVIVTDGQENSSRQYNKAQLRERIAHQQVKYGWKFLFLGANQDAIAESGGYGIGAFGYGRFKTSGGLTYEHTSKGAYNALVSASAGTRSWKLDGNETAKDFIIEPAKAANVNMAMFK